MPLDYKALMALPPRETVRSHTVRDTILYALGVGAGAEPLADLRFVYEEGLRALPTMAVVLGYPGFWLKEPQYGVDWKRVLHGEQRLTLHRPLPVEGEVVSVLTIDEIYDKGENRGALLYSRREIYDRRTGDHLATDHRASFLRGDGGCGGPASGAPAPEPIPEGPPASIIEVATRVELPAIYRLSGDYNPLHIDPAVAQEAGLPGPILHGLCTYGIVGRVLLASAAGNDPARVKRLDVRFVKPVLPGDTLVIEIWPGAAGASRYRVSAKERALVVLDNGFLQLNEGAS